LHDGGTEQAERERREHHARRRARPAEHRGRGDAGYAQEQDNTRLSGSGPFAERDPGDETAQYDERADRETGHGLTR
jgi:hypothetical protein